MEFDGLEKLVNVVIEAVDKNATVLSELKNITEHLKAQDTKLEKVAENVVDIKISAARSQTTIDTVQIAVNDHEKRLRSLNNKVNWALGAGAVLVAVAQFVVPIILKSIVP